MKLFNKKYRAELSRLIQIEIDKIDTLKNLTEKKHYQSSYLNGQKSAYKNILKKIK